MLSQSEWYCQNVTIPISSSYITVSVTPRACVRILTRFPNRCFLSGVHYKQIIFSNWHPMASYSVRLNKFGLFDIISATLILIAVISSHFQYRNFAIPVVKFYAAELVHALEYLHDTQGVIHRFFSSLLLTRIFRIFTHLPTRTTETLNQKISCFLLPIISN